MEEKWNFHGHIALPLEHYGRKMVGESFMSADEIETGGFVDAMMKALSIPYDVSTLLEFLSKCSCCVGKPAREIDKEFAKELFEGFKKLYRYKTEGDKE